MTDNHLHIHALNNAIVVPGSGTVGGIFSNGEYLKTSMVSHGWYPEKYWEVPKCVCSSAENVVYVGCFESCWGHCITDNLKFLWIFMDEQYNDLLKRCRLVYVRSNQQKKLPENFWQMLSCLGILRERLTEVTQSTRFSTVYLPDESFYSDDDCVKRCATKRYRETIDKICETITGDRHKFSTSHKVYFSRTGWKKGNPDFGERDIESCFRKLGYEIVRPETLSFRDMVVMLRQCSCFASLEGSSAHNAVFLPARAELTIIKKAEYENPYQQVIDCVADLKTTYICSHWSKLRFYHNAPYGGPFFLYISKELAAFSGENFHIDIFEFLRYVFCWAKFISLNFVRRFLGWAKRRIFR